MPDFYSEPFLCLAGLTHKSALIAWGAFYFRVKDSGDSFKLVDDDDLKFIHPPREDSIGAASKSYGPARVVVSDLAGNVVATAANNDDVNHCWVTGLEPDTEYTYKVFVKGETVEWADGPRRSWEVGPSGAGLGPKRRTYRNRFRTLPDPTRPLTAPFTFAVIGDFGVGIKKEKDRGQRQIAEALERAVDQHDVRLVLTTGDNVYRRGGLFGLIGGQTGDEDDDWYFAYHEPYRYVINRVPVYPSIGNHDADESESRDDRSQVMDNFYIRARIAGEEAAGRASLDPGLFYRFRVGANVEFVCIDSSKEPDEFPKRLFEHPKHKAFLENALPPIGSAPTTWRIPFCHHPPFCAGPRHHNTDGMDNLVTQFERAGVRLMLSGHEHNFQHSLHDKVHYVLTGGAGKLREDKPTKFTESHTQSWASKYHFLLVTIDGKKATVRVLGPLDNTGGLTDITRQAVGSGDLSTPIVITLD